MGRIFEIEHNFTGPICKDTPASINGKTLRRQFKAFSRQLGEILPLLDYVSTEVERRDLPAEFALSFPLLKLVQPIAVGVGGPQA